MKVGAAGKTADCDWVQSACIACIAKAFRVAQGPSDEEDRRHCCGARRLPRVADAPAAADGGEWPAEHGLPGSAGGGAPLAPDGPRRPPDWGESSCWARRARGQRWPPRRLAGAVAFGGEDLGPV